MRKIIKFLSLVLSIISLLIGASLVRAQGGAQVLRTCTTNGVFIAADGSYFSASAAPCQQVITPGNNYQETDQTWQPASVPKPSHAVFFNYANTGLICMLGNTGIATTDWDEVVTPSGHVTMVCRVNPRQTNIQGQSTTTGQSSTKGHANNGQGAGASNAPQQKPNPGKKK